MTDDADFTPAYAMRIGVVDGIFESGLMEGYRYTVGADGVRWVFREDYDRALSESFATIAAGMKKQYPDPVEFKEHAAVFLEHLTECNAKYGWNY